MPNGNREISGGVVGILWRALTRGGKPFRRLPGVHPMKDENGDMAPDEDREAVEISRGSRNREIVTTESS